MIILIIPASCLNRFDFRTDKPTDLSGPFAVLIIYFFGGVGSGLAVASSSMIGSAMVPWFGDRGRGDWRRLF